MKYLWECPDEDGVLREAANAESVSGSVISIIIEVHKGKRTDETVQQEQVDKEERTGNTSECAPVLDG